MNWVEIYNRLFELINVQGNAETYFSGSRFINIVKEVEPYHPDYRQYIDQRTLEKKNTSRRIYFYDILLGLDEALRIKVIKRMLDILRPFETERVEKIDVLIGPKSTLVTNTEDIEPGTISHNNTIVFISYSWDDDNHSKWVLSLAHRLANDGIEVILDKFYLHPGKSLVHFIEDSIRRANRIIIIFTPNYRLKADNRAGGVGYEYSIMNADLYKDQTTNEKVIPVLRKGSSKESIPSFMQQYIHIDITDDNRFDVKYDALLREIYNEPAIKKPQIGTRPIFD